MAPHSLLHSRNEVVIGGPINPFHDDRERSNQCVLQKNINRLSHWRLPSLSARTVGRSRRRAIWSGTTDVSCRPGPSGAKRFIARERRRMFVGCRCCCPAATLAHVCATRRDQRSQGIGSAGGFPTMAACRAELGRFPRCSVDKTGRRASLARRPVAVRQVGSSAPPVCRSDGSENGSSRRHDHAKPCSPPDRAAASRSSASSKRAALVRGGRHHRWS